MKLLQRLSVNGRIGEVYYIEERTEGTFVGVEFQDGSVEYFDVNAIEVVNENN